MTLISRWVAACVMLATIAHVTAAKPQVVRPPRPPVYDGPVIKPDEQMQRQLAALFTSPDIEPFLLQLAPLKRQYITATTEERAKLAEQIAYFQLHAEDLQTRLGSTLLWQELHVSPLAAVWGMIPYIESSDERLRTLARSILGEFDDDATRPVGSNFHLYRDYLSHRQNQPPPPQLVRYMFRRSPGNALWVFRWIDPVKWELKQPLIEMEHPVRDLLYRREWKLPVEPVHIEAAMTALRRMAEHEFWWVRRYAVEVMAQRPDLRDPALLDRFADDAHESVKHVVEEIRNYGKRPLSLYMIPG